MRLVVRWGHWKGRGVWGIVGTVQSAEGVPKGYAGARLLPHTNTAAQNIAHDSKVQVPPTKQVGALTHLDLHEGRHDPLVVAPSCCLHVHIQGVQARLGNGLQQLVGAEPGGGVRRGQWWEVGAKG